MVDAPPSRPPQKSTHSFQKKEVQREVSMTVGEVFGQPQPARPMAPPEVKVDYSAQPSSISDSDDKDSNSVPVAPEIRITSSSSSVPPLAKNSNPKSNPKVLIPTQSGHSFRTQSSTVSTKSVTFGSQSELPRLPIPSLDETLNKFLHCLEALQDEDQRKATQQIVLEFMKGDGPKLQQLLLDYDREGAETGDVGSYVEEFWNDSYLAPDDSVVLNLNPFFVLEDGPDPKIAKSPIRRAASLCFASIKMASQLRFETLKPDTFRGKALCMDQFKALFSAARVPMKSSTDIVNVYDHSNHIAVLCKSQMYYFQALWPDGDVAVDEGDLIDILMAIHSHASDMDPVQASRTALGVLTSLPRREWAIAREEIIAVNTKNEESLRIVDSALFVLVLDDYVPQNVHDAAANMLHGSYELKTNEKDYTDYQVGSCCNRWYDKLQIIVCGDGTAGINFEHSAVDGHTALRFVSDVYAETVISFAQSITKLVGHDTIPNVINAKVKRAATALDKAGRTTLDVFPKRIVFELPEKVLTRIYFAETALGDQIVASETRVIEFTDYGKLFMVGNHLSPDSVIQMSMMMAYYKLYGRIVCAYEPVLTKSFFHGRTEAMRPATPAAKELCEIWFRKDAKAESKLNALRVATNVHSQLVKECARGKGVDRHLFALKCIAQRSNLPVPKFFNSEPWRLLNHTIISTSNCGNPSLRLFGFGPVVPDGLGIGYIIKDNSIHFSISSKHRQTTRYASILESVLREIAAILRPLSNVHVPEHRKDLKSIPHHMISYDSYGDIWGESTPPPSPKPSQRWAAEPVEPPELILPEIAATATVVPDGIAAATTPAADGIAAPAEGGPVLIPALPDDNDGRWDEFEEEVVIAITPVEEEEDKAEKTAVGGKPKLKRQKSNDTLPVVPSRRGSMFSGTQRQSSFEYAELSKRDASLQMKKQGNGNDDKNSTSGNRTV